MAIKILFYYSYRFSEKINKINQKNKINKRASVEAIKDQSQNIIEDKYKVAILFNKYFTTVGSTS